MQPAPSRDRALFTVAYSRISRATLNLRRTPAAATPKTGTTSAVLLTCKPFKKTVTVIRLGYAGNHAEGDIKHPCIAIGDFIRGNRARKTLRTCSSLMAEPTLRTRRVFSWRGRPVGESRRSRCDPVSLILGQPACTNLSSLFGPTALPHAEPLAQILPRIKSQFSMRR